MQLLRQIQFKPIITIKEKIVGKIVFNLSIVSIKHKSIIVTRNLIANFKYSDYVGVLLINDSLLNNSYTMIPNLLGIIQSDHTLAEGDIVSINNSGLIRVLYRRKSIHNSLFATSACNNNCIMCSQPPIESDYQSYLDENLKIIELADSSTEALGITGGEPTLLNEDLFLIIEQCNRYLPDTHLHLLSNGRLFRFEGYVKKLAALTKSRLTVAIPINSDIDNEHDFIVQNKHAFDQTIMGILNLARYKIPVEIRVVIHKLNYKRLKNIAEFIYRNLPFTYHVAFMALEPIGLADENISLLWIDPAEYKSQLRDGILFLAKRGINVSIYNHQLCIISEDVREYSCKSISDWKVGFLPCCSNCLQANNCGGLFESALPQYHSSYIKPF
jgi:His-Xaa-Ser system radical SAM maturase HxsC